MAQQRLRPGSWKLISSGTATEDIQIDYEKFQVPPGTTVEFEVQHMALYSDVKLIAYRNPVTTVQSTTSTGIGSSAPPPPSSS
jgi:hypothetical protein